MDLVVCIYIRICICLYLCAVFCAATDYSVNKGLYINEYECWWQARGPGRGVVTALKPVRAEQVCRPE